MKLKDLKVITEATGPARFPTGVGKTTIPNPAHMSTVKYEGDPSNYNFGPQTKNYQSIKTALARHGKKLDYIGVAKSAAGPDTFVATAPGFIWQKYSSNQPGSGQNFLYINGVKVHTTTFVESSPQKQDEILGADPADLAMRFSQGDPEKFVKKLIQLGIKGAAFDDRMAKIKDKSLEYIIQHLLVSHSYDIGMKTARTLSKAKVNWPELDPAALISAARRRFLADPREGTQTYVNVHGLIRDLEHLIKVGIIHLPDPEAAEALEKIKKAILNSMYDKHSLFNGESAKLEELLNQIGVNWPEADASDMVIIKRMDIFKDLTRELMPAYRPSDMDIPAKLKSLGLTLSAFLKSVEHQKQYILQRYRDVIGDRFSGAGEALNGIEGLLKLGIVWPELAELFDDHKDATLGSATEIMLEKGEAEVFASRVLALQKIGVDWPEVKDTLGFLNSNKKAIVGSLLKMIKQNGHYGHMLDRYKRSVVGLRKLGVDWPELGAIEKVLGSELNESSAHYEDPETAAEVVQKDLDDGDIFEALETIGRAELTLNSPSIKPMLGEIYDLAVFTVIEIVKRPDGEAFEVDRLRDFMQVLGLKFPQPNMTKDLKRHEAYIAKQIARRPKLEDVVDWVLELEEWDINIFDMLPKDKKYVVSMLLSAVKRGQENYASSYINMLRDKGITYPELDAIASSINTSESIVNRLAMLAGIR